MLVIRSISPDIFVFSPGKSNTGWYPLTKGVVRILPPENNSFFAWTIISPLLLWIRQRPNSGAKGSQDIAFCIPVSSCMRNYLLKRSFRSNSGKITQSYLPKPAMLENRTTGRNKCRLFQARSICKQRDRIPQSVKEEG